MVGGEGPVHVPVRFNRSKTYILVALHPCRLIYHPFHHLPPRRQQKHWQRLEDLHALHLPLVVVMVPPMVSLVKGGATAEEGSKKVLWGHEVLEGAELPDDWW